LILAVIFSVVTPHSLVDGCQYFGGTYWLISRVKIKQVGKVAGYVEEGRNGMGHKGLEWTIRAMNGEKEDLAQMGK
jgi:hypothetical protein